MHVSCSTESASCSLQEVGGASCSLQEVGGASCSLQETPCAFCSLQEACGVRAFCSEVEVDNASDGVSCTSLLDFRASSALQKASDADMGCS